MPDGLLTSFTDVSMPTGAGTNTAILWGYMPVPAPINRYSQDTVITVTRMRVTASRSRLINASSVSGELMSQRFVH